MARSTNPILAGCEGQIGRTIVVKQYGKKTVLSKFPDMSKVKRTASQKDNSRVFAKAVAYAKAICSNPAQSAACRIKLKQGETFYRYAIKEYYALRKEGGMNRESSIVNSVTVSGYRET